MERVRSFFARHARQALFGAIVTLVSTLSFGAGYLANRDLNHAPIIIEQCAEIHAMASGTAP